MLKRRILLASLCAAACAAPLLALLGPSQTLPFAPDAQSLEYWQRGLNAGLFLLAVLAWRLNQNRLVVIAAGLAVSAAWTLRAVSAAAPVVDIANFWTLTVPAGLALSLLPEEGALFSGRTFSRGALLLLPAGLAWAVATSNPVDTARWLAWERWGGASQPSPLTLFGLLLFAFVALRRQARIEAAILALGGGLVGLSALAWGLCSAAPGTGPLLEERLWLAGYLLLACVLALGVFQLYWQRVYVDELTSIPNRRALDERLAHLPRGHGYSLAMVDIDHFKKFNDTYGHAEGDDVLRMVALHLQETTRQRAYRYGGEEFCVLAPDLDSAALASLMDATRKSLAERRFHMRPPGPLRKSKPKARVNKETNPGVQVQVTVSVGVARCDRQRDTSDKVLKLADEGLYAAKAAGRNTVVKKN